MSLVFSNFIQSSLHKSCCDIDASAVSIARYIEGGESTAETKIATPQYICVKCGNITVSAQAWHVFRYFEYMFLARKPVDPSKNSQRYPDIWWVFSGTSLWGAIVNLIRAQRPRAHGNACPVLALCNQSSTPPYSFLNIF